MSDEYPESDLTDYPEDWYYDGVARDPWDDCPVAPCPNGVSWEDTQKGRFRVADIRVYEFDMVQKKLWSVFRNIGNRGDDIGISMHVVYQAGSIMVALYERTVNTLALIDFEVPNYNFSSEKKKKFEDAIVNEYISIIDKKPTISVEDAVIEAVKKNINILLEGE